MKIANDGIEAPFMLSGVPSEFHVFSGGIFGDSNMAHFMLDHRNDLGALATKGRTFSLP